MSDLVAVLGAFACSFAAVVLIRPVCLRLGHVDHPDQRKQHTLATPLCGGLAITTSVIALGFGFVASQQFIGFAFGVSMLVVLGALDDRRHVPAAIRLVTQALAVAVGMCFLGGVQVGNMGALAGDGDIVFGPFSMAVTVFCAVGVINAINMIDGLDGLAGGFAVMAMTLLLTLTVETQAVNRVLLCLIIGSILGFLAFNLRTPWHRQARIFLGDAGSLVLGYILVWFAIQSSQGQAAVIDPITAVWLFGLPLADTLYLMGTRALRRENPLSADRYHFHHLLLRLGMSPGWALYAWLFVAACFMVVGLLEEFIDAPEAVRLVLFGTVFALYCLASNVLWRRIERPERCRTARS